MLRGEMVRVAVVVEKERKESQVLRAGRWQRPGEAGPLPRACPELGPSSHRSVSHVITHTSLAHVNQKMTISFAVILFT
jgi:hypothetical protein